MSKINRIRLSNVHYNEGSIQISDEILSLNGESTLLSLQNGGGKTVLVQLLSAPFVHARYRNTKKRRFSDYFTSSLPSFIMVEWQLDDGAGYVLTGMMVRRNDHVDDDRPDHLDILNFISAYRAECEEDIRHLPVVEHNGKKAEILSWNACRLKFDQFRHNPDKDFISYDMNNSAQRREYFRRLSEYRINYREWENIIHRVNEQEGGLGKLFEDCPQEKDLVDKWFLDEIEKKLGRAAGDDSDRAEGARIRGYQDLCEKYILQCRQQDAQIKRQASVAAFQQDAVELTDHMEAWNSAANSRDESLDRILSFMLEMDQEIDQAASDAEASDRAVMETRSKLQRLLYEELSESWYQKDEIYQDRETDRKESEDALAESRADHEACERAQHGLELAFLKSDVTEAENGLAATRQRIEIARSQEQELLPEHDYLGTLLSSHFASLRDEKQQALESCQSSRKDNAVRQKEAAEKLSASQKAFNEVTGKIGRLESNIASYDHWEEDYNRRFHTALSRNLLHLYPEGTLESEKQRIEGLTKAAQKEKDDASAELAAAGIRIRQGEDALHKAEDALYENKNETEKAELLLEQLEKEREERKDILKYAGLDETSLYDPERILQALSTKRAGIDDQIRSLTLEISRIDYELDSLKNGRTSRIPDELARELSRLGINTVYGLQWLQSNGLSEKENEAMVEAHPFLPYALVVTGQELSRIAKDDRRIYTESPVPLVTRESLAAAQERGNAAGPLYAVGDTAFYLHFNHALLDEKRRQQMIEDLTSTRQGKQDILSQRQQESDTYLSRMNQLRSQTLTREALEGAEHDLSHLQEQKEMLEEERRKQADELAALRERQNSLTVKISTLKTTLLNLAGQERDLAELTKKYEAITAAIKEKDACMDRQSALEKDIQGLEKLRGKLAGEAEELLIQSKNLEQEMAGAAESALVYAAFEGKPLPEKPETLTIDPGDITSAQARYRAIEEKTSGMLRALEEEQKRDASSLEKARKKLSGAMRRYHMEEADFAGITPDEAKQDALAEELNRLQDQIDRLNDRNRVLTSQAAVAENNRNLVLQQIEEECGEKSPLAREEITVVDFHAERQHLEEEAALHEKEKNQYLARQQTCQSMLDMLDRYREEKPEPSRIVPFEEDFASMSGDRLRIFARNLTTACDGFAGTRDKERELFADVLRKLTSSPAYADDFFQKPLESLTAMLEAFEAPGAVQEHLAAILASFERTMEKLAVDLEMLGRDRKELINQLFDYVRAVHTELGKIDRNSTIHIGGRPVRMLRIELPDFAANENLCRTRLETMFDHLKDDGLEALGPEHNTTALHELIGRRLTTRELYNEVVGTSSVHIHLRKIEASREVPISWAEAQSSSGGESFVSAFVILSSLLYYMREDENDITSGGNEGKVLLMDNPFGVVSSAHLLIPMMELAEKNNTQLICLSALSGGEIYDRFSNIYVLNLVPSSFNHNVSYLKPRHQAGPDIETLVSARIRVTDSGNDSEDDRLLF